MNIGIIGIGNRSTAYFKLHEYGNDARITALCDINDSKIDIAVREYFNDDKNIRRFHSYEAMLADNEIDAVVICTPDSSHVPVMLEAVRKNKKILIEKPVAIDKEGLELLYLNCHDYRQTILPGFVLRYTKLYQKIRELIDSNEIGELITIEANETLTPVHAASFFRRWHSHSANNGGFLNAKCSHDLDLINMMIGKKPLFVASFGSNIHFRNTHNDSLYCSLCKKQESCKYVDKTVNRLSGADNDLCPYMADSDIVDHQAVMIEYEGGVTASFTVSMHAGEGNRMMTVYGSEGVIRSDFKKQEIVIDYSGTDNKKIISLSDMSSGHGGGDEGLCRLFISKNEINQIHEGIMSSLIALAAEESRKKKCVISMKEFAHYLY